MSDKQRDMIKTLISDELEFGFFNRNALAIKKLGGPNWESQYRIIPNSVVDEVVSLLKESLHQNQWAWERGYV